MDAQERAKFIEQYRDGYTAVAEALLRITPEELDARTGDGKWSPREIVHHLADSEMAAAMRLRLILAEDRPRLIVEVNPPLLRPLGQTPRDLFSRIERHGYCIFGIREARGLMNGGRFELTPLSDTQEACDIFCLPEEAAGEFRARAR